MCCLRFTGLCSTGSQGLAVAQSPTAHGILPRSEEVFRGTLRAPLTMVARELPSKAFSFVNSFPYGACEQKQFVVTTSVRMQFRQKQPPHMPVLEKHRSINVACLSHELSPPAVVFVILGAVKIPCKARNRATATPRRANPAPPPYMWPRTLHRTANHSVAS